MHNIDEIKSKITCVSYLQMEGINIKSGGRCTSPLRPEATNKTSFYVEDDFWYDFGSGQGGDVIDLASHLHYGGNKGDAIRGLASMLGIESDDFGRNWRDDIQNLCNRTAAYHEALTPSDYDYLSRRGLSNDDIHRLMIGRVTDGYLKGRLFLPYFKNGAVVYYATRSMPNGSVPDSKYMKAARKESPHYENIPWGLQTLDRGNDTLIISEGYFDAVSWETNGYSVLSPITGAFSSEQWPLVISACRNFKRVVLIFDNDDISHAGEKFTLRTAQKLFQNRITFSVAYTPIGIKDVNDYYAAGGKLSVLIEQAIEGNKFLAKQLKTIEDVKKFIFSVRTQLGETELASLVSSLSDNFSQMELKAVLSEAKRGPQEKEIVEQLVRDNNIIYVDKVGFYLFNGKIWERVSDLYVEKLAYDAYGVFATAKRVQSVRSLMKSYAMQDVVFDRKPLISFQNGTLEIETGKLRDHSPMDYCSTIMSYNYDADARSELWEKFVNDTTHDDPYRTDLLQSIAGYIMFPDCRHQKVFLLVGSGGNGKSLYLEILQRLFGASNTTFIEPTGLTKEFERIRLKDSWLNIGADIDSDFSKGEIREWMLKVSDGTSIQACYKGKDHIDFMPRCKLIYACNSIPSAEIVNGLDRRFMFVQFPCRFVDNPNPNNPYEKSKDITLLDKLSTPQSLSAIFNWAYEGYRSLLRSGYFTETLEQTNLLEQFSTISNPISVFCDDFEFTGEAPRDFIYERYRQWCDETGHKAFSREKFIPKFRDAMGDRILEETQVRRNGKVTRVFKF